MLSYGAIIGDIAGSSFEYLYHKFPIDNWTVDELMMVRGATFTDDSIMTIAVMDALYKMKDIPSTALLAPNVKVQVISMMEMYGTLYKNRGFGHKFTNWIFDPEHKPYESFGNGAAMRISPVGWLYNDKEVIRNVSRWVTDVSHNSDIARKGAQATAESIYYLRKGMEKDELKATILKDYDYKVNCILENVEEEMKKIYGDIRCDVAVTKALVAFLNTDNFGDCIKTAIKISLDTDTVAAIAGSIAEAYYYNKNDQTYFDANAMARSKVGLDFRNVVKKFSELVVE